MLKVKLMSTTNNLAKCIIGRECELIYDITAYFQFDPEGLDFDYRKGDWRTSLINNIKIEEVSKFCYDITITTGNSEYVFRKGEFSNEEPLTEKEKMNLALSMIF